MAFKEWSAFGADPIKVPIQGRSGEYVTYELPVMSATVGHQWRLLQEDPEADVPMRQWTQEQERRAYLGDAVYEAMLADGVPDEALTRALLVVQYDWLLGREAAEMVWTAKDASPKALSAKVAEWLRSQMGSTSTAADGSTLTPASTSTTTSQKGTRSTKPAPKARPSRGRGSRTGGGSSKPTGPVSTDET